MGVLCLQCKIVIVTAVNDSRASYHAITGPLLTVQLTYKSIPFLPPHHWLGHCHIHLQTLTESLGLNSSQDSAQRLIFKGDAGS